MIPKELHHVTDNSVSCLQSNIQEAIREAKKELKFDYLRIRDIFSDDLYIYYEDGDHNVRYNWNYIDMVLDFFVSLDIKPVIFRIIQARSAVLPVTVPEA